MEHHQYRYKEGDEQVVQAEPQQTWQTTAVLPVPQMKRPLSDIREMTEPSLNELMGRRSVPPQQLHHFHQCNVSKATSLRRTGSLKRKGSSKIVEPASSSPESPPDQSSIYSIPPSSVPPRASSQAHEMRAAKSHMRKLSLPIAPQDGVGHKIPNRGPGRSPVKQAVERFATVVSDRSRRIPSRTFIRNPLPTDIPEFIALRHPRVSVDLQVAAPLFVGGGSIEGYVRVTVDEGLRVRHKKNISIGRLSVDLLGVEEVSGNRRSIFLSLGTELLDAEHPPPPDMVVSTLHLSTDEPFWTLVPSQSALPFMLSLPLDTGPPPFHSKSAKIRYLLCTTMLVKDAGKQYLVRSTQDVSVLSTYDPEKALTSLPSPLTAADELFSARGSTLESIRVTAGLHRQVWVSGTTIFVDVHIANKTRKGIKRLDLNIERDILCYKHAAAATMEKSASQARIFESNEQTILTRTTLRQGSNGWSGVEAYSSDTRTCDLDLPRGHATVKCGKYFEVRYFLNVTVSASHSRIVSVQLPIILIHMNSLDVLPNSVAQVAAAIEEKRHRRRQPRSQSRKTAAAATGHSRNPSPSSPLRAAQLRHQASVLQGRAFAAPRQQSLDRARAEAANLEELGEILDSSPRKYAPQQGPPMLKKMASTMSFGALSLGGKSPGGISIFGGMEYHTPPSNRKARHFDAADGDEVNAVRERLRRLRSFDSLRSKRSNGSTWSHNRKPNAPPTISKPARVLYSALQHETGALPQPPQSSRRSEDRENARPGTTLGFRDKVDRSRFDFKGLRRRASGASGGPGAGLRGKGSHWWDQVRHRDSVKEMEGWI